MREREREREREGERYTKYKLNISIFTIKLGGILKRITILTSLA
jgi:hypothetical protein